MKNTFSFKIQYKHNFPYLGKNQRNIINNRSNKIEFNKIEKKYPSYFNLIIPDNYLKLCEEIIKKIQIDPNKKNICIHIRDPEYHNDKFRRPYRNPKIENYLSTIEYLCDNDYNVFRMGIVAQEKIQINKKNFFDIPFLLTPNEIEYFQFYLIKNSKLFIGTESGPQFISWFLNIPTLYTNVARFFYITAPNQNSRYIFRKFFSKQENKIIDYKNYIKLPFLYHNINYVDDGIEYIENSSDEILNATKEMLTNINDNNWELSQKQIEMNDLLKNRLMQMYEEYSEKNKGNNLIDQWDNLNIIKNSISNYGSVCNSMFKPEKNN